MKKITFLIFALLTIFISQAQEIKYGLKGGLNTSNLKGIVPISINSNQKEKSIFGVNLGCFVEIKLTEKLAFQPELIFSMQGNKLERDEEQQKGVFISKTRINYLNIPLLVKYYIENKLYVEFGPQVGLLLNIKQDVSNISIFDPALITNEDNKDINDITKKTDYGFNLGLGFEFSDRTFINIRSNFAPSNINDVYASKNKIQNEVFQISIGYKL
jgi:hypothetical protein